LAGLAGPGQARLRVGALRHLNTPGKPGIQSLNSHYGAPLPRPVYHRDGRGKFHHGHGHVKRHWKVRHHHHHDHDDD